MSVPDGAEDRIIHARLSKGSVVVMASDTIPGDPFVAGANFSVCVDCDDIAEQDRIFAALGEGSRNVRPPQDTYWGARFGTLTDRFGVNWMLNCQRQQAG
jgi:PhnB protein